MTIDEAIKKLSSYARSAKFLAEKSEGETRDKFLKNARNFEQEIEWLCELQDRRCEPEVTYCKDCRKHNVKVGFDENFHTVWKEDACPLVNWRGKAKRHEFDYQFCVYGKRKERRTDE